MRATGALPARRKSTPAWPHSFYTYDRIEWPWKTQKQYEEVDAFAEEGHLRQVASKQRDEGLSDVLHDAVKEVERKELVLRSALPQHTPLLAPPSPQPGVFASARCTSPQTHEVSSSPCKSRCQETHSQEVSLNRSSDAGGRSHVLARKHGQGIDDGLRVEGEVRQLRGI